jgi:hypothetical protein
MDFEKFSIDGADVRFRQLAWAPFSRADFERISAGSSPEDFRQSDRAPLWGIAYILDDAVGFYVNASVPSSLSSMVGLKSEPLPAIDFRIPFTAFRAARYTRPREPKTRFGKFLASIIVKSENVIEIEWEGEGGASFCARLFAAQDTREFERLVSEKSGR